MSSTTRKTPARPAQKAPQPKAKPKRGKTPPPTKPTQTSFEVALAEAAEKDERTRFQVQRGMFLAELATTFNVQAAALKAQVSRQYMYELRAKDPEFAKQWAEAEAAALDALRGAVYERATRISDRLAVFLLSAHLPAIYGDADSDGDKRPVHVHLGPVAWSPNGEIEKAPPAVAPAPKGKPQ